eukprot:scaffold55868_cov58-Phaeocystis_antarctica.AAC.1
MVDEHESEHYATEGREVLLAHARLNRRLLADGARDAAVHPLCRAVLGRALAVLSGGGLRGVDDALSSLTTTNYTLLTTYYLLLITCAVSTTPSAVKRPLTTACGYEPSVGGAVPSSLPGAILLTVQELVQGGGEARKGVAVNVEVGL